MTTETPSDVTTFPSSPDAHIWQPLSSALGEGPGPDQAAFHLSSKASIPSSSEMWWDKLWNEAGYT